MTRKLPAVTILTSGVGLGVYIPALLIQRQLCQSGCAADVEVLENYYTPERQQAHLAHRDAHHSSFALAQMAHRMVRDVQDCFDEVRTELLIDRWIAEGRDRFIVWSGFWLPLIERYRQLRGGGSLHVDHCRIDAEISASFKIYPHLQKGNSIWLWNWAERRIVHEVSVKAASSIPFHSRDNRLVVHGGGWGIGTYQERAAHLNGSGYALDLIIHDVKEAGCHPENRYFMLDPCWRAWNKASDGMHDFPPMGEFADSGEITYQRNPHYHPLYDVIRRSKGIMSKPGGCTLIDSLSSATPVILLEPYGYAESSNGQIWEYLGFGIPYEKWRETGYSMSVLEKLHLNLLSRAGHGLDYPQAYAARLVQE